MAVPVQVVHCIAVKVLFRNLTFPDQFTCEHVFPQNLLHVVDPFRNLVSWASLFEKSSKIFRNEYSRRGFPNHAKALTHEACINLDVTPNWWEG